MGWLEWTDFIGLVDIQIYPISFARVAELSVGPYFIVILTEKDRAADLCVQG